MLYDEQFHKQLREEEAVHELDKQTSYETRLHPRNHPQAKLRWVRNLFKKHPTPAVMQQAALDLLVYGEAYLKVPITETRITLADAYNPLLNESHWYTPSSRRPHNPQRITKRGWRWKDNRVYYRQQKVV